MKKLGIHNFTVRVVAFGLGGATAQGFPSKPMRILVPGPAGSSPDIRGRQIGARLSTAFGRLKIG